MQRPRLVLAALACSCAAILAAFALTAALSTPHAQAGPGPGPTPTPKIASDGSLTGIYDSVLAPYVPTGDEGGGPSSCSDTFDNDADTLIDAGDPDCKNAAVGFYNCIARLDHDGTSNDVKVAARCYSDSPPGAPYNAVPFNTGEGGDGIPGPPAPPPYAADPPTKLTGTYDPSGSGTLTYSGCFDNTGATIGPNSISVIEVTSPKGQLASDDHLTGKLSFYPNQSNANCTAVTPSGSPLIYTLNSYLAGGSSEVAWRTSSTDFDGDGCTDFEELDKQGTFPDCGDDPFNPYDSSSSDYTGTYQAFITVTRADWTTSLVPGSFINCLFDLQQSVKDLTAPIYCYFDNAVDDVNPEDAPGTKGDGWFGPFPPEPFGDIDGAHSVLTGVLDNDFNTISLEGCILDEDGESPVGYVYMSITFDVHTGLGAAVAIYNQTEGNCTGGTPSGLPDVFGADVWAVRQSTGAQQRDTDTDGCPDASELTNDETIGGLRDPFNPWDYFNPTNDGHIRMDDFLAVLERSGQTPPGPPYDEKYDRTSLTGGNVWNLGGPDDLIDFDDFYVVGLQYGHDCGSGSLKGGTPTPLPTAAAGLEFSMAVDVNGDTTNDCDTNTGTTHCLVGPGNPFTVKVSLNSTPFAYNALDIFMNYFGITSSDNADSPWPGCAAQITLYKAGSVLWGCAGASFYTGVVGTNGFTCNESGSVSLVHGVNDTVVLVNSATKLVEGTGSSETLDITCGTPTATPTPIATVVLLGNPAATDDPGDGPDGPLSNSPKADSPRGIDAPQVGGGGGGEAAGVSDALYYADTGNNKVKEIDFSTSELITLAGTGTAGYNGEGTATTRQLNQPRDVFVAPSGDIYIADTDNCRVRKITAGVMSTVAGTSTCGYNGEGTATSAQLDHPSGIAVDADDNLYIADTENCRIRKVTSAGVISTVAGTGDCGYTGDSVLATTAQLNRPRDVSILLPDDDLVIADTDNHRIRRVGLPSGVITSIAGTGVPGYSSSATVASTAAVDAPEALDAAGYRVIFADTGNDRIRRINTLRNTITTMVGPDGLAIATLTQPGGVALLNVAADGTGGESAAFTEVPPDRIGTSAVPSEGGTVDTLEPTTSCTILPGTSSIDWMLPAVLLGLVLFRKRVTTLFIRLNSAARSLRRPQRVPTG